MTRLKQIPKFLYLILCFALYAAPLFAQDRIPVFKGTVTLPFETRWGTAVLPPGEYTLSVLSTTLPAKVTIRGKDVSAFIHAQTLDTHINPKSKSYLLVSKWRRGVVRSLYLSELGMSFNYATPKEETKEMMQEAVLIQRLPVTQAKD